jgi:serine/threonine-protein kinase HipA
MVIAKLRLGDEAIGQAFRRMTFNVLARNCDDHTKNFSFLRKQAEEWELAPTYDLTHAYNPKGEWAYQHLMSVNGKFREITWEDLLQEEDRFGVRRPQSLLADVRAALGGWLTFAKEAGLGSSTLDRVAADFHSV